MAFVTVNGAQHYFRLEGSRDKPALVLAHPIGADCGFWSAQADAFARRFCVLRYDLRGHGASQTTPGDYSIDLLCADLLALADVLRLETFSLCGVSLGGMVALGTAARAPGRVRAIAVCSTATRVASPPGGWEGRAQVALANGMASLSGPMVQRMFTPAFRESGDLSPDNLKNVFELTDPAGYASTCAVLRDADLEPVLRDVVAPTLVVSGQSDVLCPPAAALAMSQALPSASFFSMDSGHFPSLELPSKFNTVVLDHFDGS